MSNLTVTELAITLAVGIVTAGYVAFILVPAVSVYTRFWEKVGAGFLSLFILATLIGIGAALGFFVVWSYDSYA